MRNRTLNTENVGRAQVYALVYIGDVLRELSNSDVAEALDRVAQSIDEKPLTT